MPGVLMIETMAQVAGLLLLDGDRSIARAWLRGVDNAKFRSRVVPGDRLHVEIVAGPRRGAIARLSAVATIDGSVAAEAELVMGLEVGGRRAELGVRKQAADVHPTAIVHPNAKIGDGTVVGPFVTIGEHVTIGRNNSIGASTVIDGLTTIGD